LRVAPGQFVGIVYDAPDEQAAIKKAIFAGPLRAGQAPEPP
jgi:hypothetical protein